MTGHGRRSRAVLALITLGIAGCRGGSEADRAPASYPDRELLTSRWDTAWVRGGTSSDTLLLLPIAMAADDRRVYLLDSGARRVVALRASDGALLWTAGRRGVGPGEFSAANAIAVAASGEVLVYDHRAVRITVLDTLGSVVREIATPDVGYIQSLCPLRDGSMLASTLASARPLVRLSAQGTPIARFDLPWPELAQVPPIARQTGMVATPDRGRCVLALSMGEGFAVFRGSTVESTHGYVERVRLPEVEVRSHDAAGQRSESAHLVERTIAATDLVADDTALYASFEGTSPARGRIIDVYDLGTGAYRGSYGFHRPIARVARAGGTFLILHQVDGYPALLAATPRAGRRAPGQAAPASATTQRGDP